MKKILLLPLLLVLSACASSNKPNSKINCEKTYTESAARMIELQKLFETYQEVNYDLSAKLMPAYKNEVDEFYTRVKNEKKACWARDKKQVDVDIVDLREELAKIYVVQPLAPPRVVASPAAVEMRKPTPAPPANSTPLNLPPPAPPKPEAVAPAAMPAPVPVSPEADPFPAE